MREGKDVQKRRLNASYKNLVLALLAKAAAHFRIELSGEEAEIFLDRLPSWSDYQIKTAFERVLVECLFFPKLRELLDRMPAERAGVLPLCPRCNEDGWGDGWVVVPSQTNPGYNVAVRCDHVTSYPPPNNLALLYKNPPEWATKRTVRTDDRAPEVKNPRYPHLIGKGILYKDVK